jgi:hypothetical protein
MGFHQAIGGGVSVVVAVMVWAAAGKAIAQAARPAVKANNFISIDPFTGAEAHSPAAPSLASAAASAMTKCLAPQGKNVAISGALRRSLSGSNLDKTP